MLENQSQQSWVYFYTSSYASPVPESKSKVDSNSPHMNNEFQMHLRHLKDPEAEGPLGMNPNKRHLSISENPTWHILHSFRSPKSS